ncbi:replication protein RepA [Shewanella algae]|uniref:replication protein RepA n=1 Tax=Shewanella algae TaxID=38313 RepID=UPI0031F58FEB
MLSKEQIKSFIREKPEMSKSVGFYPAFLIDPCCLPLESTDKDEEEVFGNYQHVTIKSAKSLPHGHYARLIIAYLTTEIIKRPELPSYIIGNSASDLFKRVTGQSKVSGGTFYNFMECFQRVLGIEFIIKPTHKSNTKIEIIGSFSDFSIIVGNDTEKVQHYENYKKILFTPSKEFKKLLIEYRRFISIDMRFLRLSRNKKIALADDLYIYLVRRGYMKKRTSFIRLNVLQKDIFPYLKHLTPSRFKSRLENALDFIKDCHPDMKSKLSEDGGFLEVYPNCNLLRVQPKDDTKDNAKIE